MTSPKAVLGLRAHSGWTAMVVITGSVESPSVLDRQIIQLHNPNTLGAKQPYHAAEPLPFKDAEKLVARCIEETQALAYRGMSDAMTDLKTKGLEVTACGILLSSGRKLPASLQTILASHAMIHTAEGELFRNALLQAAARCKLPVTAVKEREVFSRATEVLGHPEDQLRACLSDIGRSLGPPWRQDQKYATLAGWIALATSTRAASAR